MLLLLFLRGGSNLAVPIFFCAKLYGVTVLESLVGKATQRDRSCMGLCSPVPIKKTSLCLTLRNTPQTVIHVSPDVYKDLLCGCGLGLFQSNPYLYRESYKILCCSLNRGVEVVIWALIALTFLELGEINRCDFRWWSWIKGCSKATANNFFQIC